MQHKTRNPIFENFSFSVCLGVDSLVKAITFCTGPHSRESLFIRKFTISRRFLGRNCCENANNPPIPAYFAQYDSMSIFQSQMEFSIVARDLLVRRREAVHRQVNTESWLPWFL
jgi:hypothetical protein